MKIKIIAVGTHMPDWVSQGYVEYAKRLSRPYSLDVIEIPLQKRGKNADLVRIAQQEGELMLGKIEKNDWIIALDSRGSQWTTPELAQHIQQWQEQGRNMSLLIGGPEGLAPQCLQKAHVTWSLSKLTFPHPLVRVIVAEQLYRGLSLLAGHPYHK